MLFASIWTTTNATNLKDAIVDKQIEFLTTYKLNNTPEITTDNIIKLEGYILLYNSPTTISITTNGDFEIYIDNIQILKSTNNGSTDIYNKGILPFECYIKPASIPFSYQITPNKFTLNNGYIQFKDPRSLRSKITKITFINPNEFVHQKYYINNVELETSYNTYEQNENKYTETTIIIPPET